MSNTKEPQKKKAGRPKNENFLPWNEARELVRGEKLPSRSKYFEWWDQNKPKTLPRFPYRVYKTEWKGWADFLDTTNEFRAVKRSYRPYKEAIVYVHNLALESHQAWVQHVREKGLPDDIPSHPELIYKEWTSWNHWLGNKAIERLEAAKDAQTAAIYYIIQEPEHPSNVLTFGVERGGISALKMRWQRREPKFTVVKMFRFKPEAAKIIQQILNSFSAEYYGDPQVRIVPNVWEIISRFQLLMETA